MNTFYKHLILMFLAISLAGCASNSSEQEEVEVAETSSPSKEQLVVAEIKPMPSRMEAARQLHKTHPVSATSFVADQVVHHRPTHMPVEHDLAGEKYAQMDWNSIQDVINNPVSTFSIDVDTGAYSNMRRIIQQGMLPPKNAIRTEELINYFDYNYRTPATKEKPFLVNSSLVEAPWNSNKHLLQIGIKAWEQSEAEIRKAANLVFLIDVSGSMNQANKLPLLKQSLRMMSRQMSADDRVAIVVYAGASGIVLKPTPGNDTLAIEQALANLQAGGSTNGEAGIKLAYQLAEQAFITDGINRILLATDGDFNVGQANTEALIELIERQRSKGIAFSTLGFGAGNYNDHLMEQLANHGDGNYSYIDNLLEARKVLVDELDSQLITVAKDVKLQLEFNPAQVAEYRLIGYENRTLAREDFDNDAVDAGEIGAGHTVTAIYELTLADSKQRSLAPLRYQQDKRAANYSEEIGFMRVRFKAPGETVSQLIETPLVKSELLAVSAQAKQDLMFSAAVVAFADKLQGGKYTAGLNFSDIEQIAQENKGKDISGIRAEFARLVRLAATISQNS